LNAPPARALTDYLEMTSPLAHFGSLSNEGRTTIMRGMERVGHEPPGRTRRLSTGAPSAGALSTGALSTGGGE
jgi:hypothetical protein